MSDENQAAIELSEQELDTVAGGSFGLIFSATFFEQIDSVFLHNTHSDKNGSSTSYLRATRQIRTFAIQGLFMGETPSPFGYPNLEE